MKCLINNERLNPVVTELFIRGRKLGISIALTFIILKLISMNI